MIKKVGSTVPAVKTGCHAGSRCCLNAESNAIDKRVGWVIRGARNTTWEIDKDEGVGMDSANNNNSFKVIHQTLYPLWMRCYLTVSST